MSVQTFLLTLLITGASYIIYRIWIYPIFKYTPSEDIYAGIRQADEETDKLMQEIYNMEYKHNCQRQANVWFREWLEWYESPLNDLGYRTGMTPIPLTNPATAMLNVVHAETATRTDGLAKRLYYEMIEEYKAKNPKI